MYLSDSYLSLQLPPNDKPVSGGTSQWIEPYSCSDRVRPNSVQLTAQFWHTDTKLCYFCVGQFRFQSLVQCKSLILI